MQFQALVLSTLAALAAAQTTTPTFSLPTAPLSRTASAPTATSTGNLVALVQGLPVCGVKCLSDAAKRANCGAADLKCLCSNSGALTGDVSLALCVSGNCKGDETTRLLSDAPQVCDKINNGASQAEITSASNIVASAIGTAGLATSATAGGLAPRMTNAPAFAVVGGAAAAAFAAYAI